MECEHEKIYSEDGKWICKLCGEPGQDEADMTKEEDAQSQGDPEQSDTV